MRVRLWPIALFAALAIAAAWAALTSGLGADYPGPPCSTCDYPGPALDALTAGHIGTFFHVQPVMGSVSLLLRAPFVALAHGDLWRYRVGALVCLLAVAALAWWVTLVLAEHRRPRVTQLAVGLLIVASPLSLQALSWGHPEEPLAGVLCVVAVLLADRRRPVLAGAALGLAVATKQWALLAVIPVAMVAVGGRRTLLASAAGTAAVFTLPLVIGDPSRFFHITSTFSASSGGGLTPSNIWWPLGHQTGVEVTSHGMMSTYGLPLSLHGLSHPLVMVAAVAVAAGFWWRRPERGPSDALGLLALIFLVRCLLDTMTYGYHHVPLLICLAVFEGLRRRALPFVTIALALAAWLMQHVVAPVQNPDLTHQVYLAWSLPLLGYLAVAVFRPSLRSSAAPVPNPT